MVSTSSISLFKQLIRLRNPPEATEAGHCFAKLLSPKIAARLSSRSVALCNLPHNVVIVAVAFCFAGACASRIRNILFSFAHPFNVTRLGHVGFYLVGDPYRAALQLPRCFVGCCLEPQLTTRQTSTIESSNSKFTGRTPGKGTSADPVIPRISCATINQLSTATSAAVSSLISNDQRCFLYLRLCVLMVTSVLFKTYCEVFLPSFRPVSSLSDRASPPDHPSSSL